MNVEKLKELHDRCLDVYAEYYGAMSSLSPQLKAQEFDNGQLCDIGYLCRDMEKKFDELRKEAKARQELSGSMLAFNITKASVEDPNIDPTARGQYSTGTPDCRIQAKLPKKDTPEYFAIFEWLVHHKVCGIIAEKMLDLAAEQSTSIAEELYQQLGKVLCKELTETFSQNVKEAVNASFINASSDVEGAVRYVLTEIAKEAVLKLSWNEVEELCTKLTQSGKALPPGIGDTYPKYTTTFRKGKTNG